MSFAITKVKENAWAFRGRSCRLPHGCSNGIDGFAGDSDRGFGSLSSFVRLFVPYSLRSDGIGSIERGKEHEFRHYEDLEETTWLAFVLVCGVASLAGIPPFAGFIAKALLISVAYEAKLYLSLVALVIGVVISIYYYFAGFARCLEPRRAFKEERDEEDRWSDLKDLGS